MCDMESDMSGVRTLKGKKTAATQSAGSTGALQKLARRHPEVSRALAVLTAKGAARGVRSSKISARVDPGILAAAAERLGFAPTEVSDVVNAALAIAAAPDSFKDWFRQGGEQLPEDFELAI